MVITNNSQQPTIPEGIVDVILDTDAYNEIDDQFAIAYMLLSPEKFNVKGICAAPFLNERSNSPLDGMERSYNEILKLLGLLKREDMKKSVYKGSCGYLPDEKTKVESPAAHFIAESASAYSPEKPLYIVAIGAISNVASAILENPEAAKNTVIVWLGGHSREFKNTAEFNMMQDVAAARVVFTSGAKTVQLPCVGVVSMLTAPITEMKYYLYGKNPLCDYLYENTLNCNKAHAFDAPWSRVIWDIATVAWFFNEKDCMMSSRFTDIYLPGYDNIYEKTPTGGTMEYVYNINRDAVLSQLYKKLTEFKG